MFDSHVDNSLLGSAAVVNQDTIRNCIIRREPVIEPTLASALTMMPTGAAMK